MTPQCPTCEGVGSVLVCSNCQNPACARGEMFCERYRTSGFDHITCKDCGGKGTIPSSKEPQQPKEDKLERIRKICYTANYDNHKYPDERSILVAIHDVIYEDCKDCRRKRDLCPLHKTSKEYTECTCSNRLAANPAKWPTHSGIHEKKCPLYREPKQESLDIRPILRSGEWTGHKQKFGPLRSLDEAEKEILAKFHAWHTQKLREIQEEIKRESWDAENYGIGGYIVDYDVVEKAINRALKETE